MVCAYRHSRRAASHTPQASIPHLILTGSTDLLHRNGSPCRLLISSPPAKQSGLLPLSQEPLVARVGSQRGSGCRRGYRHNPQGTQTALPCFTHTPARYRRPVRSVGAAKIFHAPASAAAEPLPLRPPPPVCGRPAPPACRLRV